MSLILEYYHGNRLVESKPKPNLAIAKSCVKLLKSTTHKLGAFKLFKLNQYNKKVIQYKL
jgi:hypothetical protein